MLHDMNTIADLAIELRERYNPVLTVAIIDDGYQVSLSLGMRSITVGAAFLYEALCEAFKQWDANSPAERMVPCKVCKGTGAMYDYPGTTCKACRGEGWTKVN